MIDAFFNISLFLKNKKIGFKKESFNEVIKNYLFLVISKEKSLNQEEKEAMNQNIKFSKVIIIDQSENLNKQMGTNSFIVGFEKTIIILEQLSLPFLQSILSSNSNLQVCFLSNTKKLIDPIISIKNNEIKNDNIFDDRVKSLKNSMNLFKITQNEKLIWSCISKCISCYLLRKCYFKLKEYRFKKYKPNNEIENKNDNFCEKIEEKDYFEIGNLETGSVFALYLIYHIKKEELLVIKKPHYCDFESPKLMQRELNNYLQIKHPLIPKFYGKIKNKDFIVIEYINGKTLSKIDMSQFTLDDIFYIILGLMIVIHYFQNLNMIYRDLKPNNVIIDENKTVVLIDFDRLILNKEDQDNEQTLVFSDFSDPEINETKKFSMGSDIYSLGKMIEYILNQAENCIKSEKDCFYSTLKKISEMCMIEKAINRPSISDVISLISIEEKQYVPKNIDKLIQYLSLAANQNHSDAQNYLRKLYSTREYTSQIISKIILANSHHASKDDLDTIYDLGLVYYQGEYTSRNINIFSVIFF